MSLGVALREVHRGQLIREYRLTHCQNRILNDCMAQIFHKAKNMSIQEARFLIIDESNRIAEQFNFENSARISLQKFMRWRLFKAAPG